MNALPSEPALNFVGFPGLVAILARLRAPDGCPWDREQTHESLAKYLLEESAEAVEAIRSANPFHLAEELGDVLLQVVFHAQLAAEAGRFTIDDVVEGINQKMVRRHPHVFGTESAATAADVKDLWQVVKDKEKAAVGQHRQASALDKINKGLPALSRAQALQKAAAKVGFAWPDAAEALAKVREETAEVEAEMASGDRPRLAEEYGDLLLAVAALGRYLDLDAESELVHGNAKFEARFRALEAGAGGPEAMKRLPAEELLMRWDAVKDGFKE